MFSEKEAEGNQTGEKKQFFNGKVTFLERTVRHLGSGSTALGYGVQDGVQYGVQYGVL